MKKEIKRIFDSNSKLDEVFETSDGNAFYLESDAKNHAKTLKNDKVVKHLRPAEDESKGSLNNFMKEIIEKAVNPTFEVTHGPVNTDEAPKTDEDPAPEATQEPVKTDEAPATEVKDEAPKTDEAPAPEATQEPVKTDEAPTTEKVEEKTLFDASAPEEKNQPKNNKANK